MKRPPPRARRPGARAGRGPVGDQLGGETPPAVCLPGNTAPARGFSEERAYPARTGSQFPAARPGGVEPGQRYLPPPFEYRIIFMERDPREVFASQSDMLRTRGADASDQNQDRLIAAFAVELLEIRNWLAAQQNMQTMFASYAEVVRDAARTSAELSRFLGEDLNTSAMADVVEPQLYRHRSDG